MNEVRQMWAAFVRLSHDELMAERTRLLTDLDFWKQLPDSRAYAALRFGLSWCDLKLAVVEGLLGNQRPTIGK